MEKLTTRVEKILRKEFSPREIRVEPAGKGKLDGWIITKSFDKLTDKERQRKVWELFEAYLSEKDRHRILGFFTFTPFEEKMIFDGNFDILKISSKKKSSSAKRAAAAGRNNGRLGQKRR